MPTINVNNTQNPIDINNGGTGSSSFYSGGILYFDGTKINSSQYFKISSSACRTNTKQPLFLSKSSAVSNVTGNGTEYTILGGGGVPYDQASNYNATTGIFTAPIAGIYRFSASFQSSGGSTETECKLKIVTTNHTYFSYWSHVSGASSGYDNLCFTTLAKMSANDTAYASVIISGNGSDGCSLVAGTDHEKTSFYGVLVC